MTRLLAGLLAAPLLLPMAAAAQNDSTPPAPAAEAPATAAPAEGGATPPQPTLEQRFSYMLGLQMAQGLVQRQMHETIDIDFFAIAMKDVFSGREPRMSPEAMQATMQEMQAKQAQGRLARREVAKAEGEAFLAQNKDAEGVQVSPTGVQYRIDREGEGVHPKGSDSVVVHYAGRLLTGKEFDSSYKRGQPATFRVNQVIPGWQEALKLMKVGAKYEVWIPSHLAYGERGSMPAIGPNETLNFTIELLAVNPG